ncbi:hypothetical protein [Actinoplanes sp. CA-252034]|uniref:hypothetical protein n=1 Tax=Actinoplanes sp. CA-252034 TaxID=3239906 RepID=UPI003D99B05F
MAVIVAPNREYNGQIGDVVFKNGRAETDNTAVIGYCRGAGYEVNGRVDNPAARPRIDVDSSRTHQPLGTPLRDAAVSPRLGDFLPPIGAGKADPHGPTVVSPEIHASPGPTPLVPGLVPADPAAQQDREIAAAKLTLVDQLADTEQSEQPAGNASQEAWADWVLATHPDQNPDTIRAMKRDELRDQYSG